MKKITRQILFFLSVSSISFFSCAQTSNSLYEFVKGKADTAFTKDKMPGIFIAYSNKGKDAFYTAGYAQPETKTVFDRNTFFEIGSVTKTFTAYTLMSVLRDHNISDTTSILPYLPDEVQANKALEPIRFLNLLNHTSGLPRLPDNLLLKKNNLQPYAMYDSKLLFEYLATAKPANKGAYGYSNLGAGLAGVLAERISGKTYASLLDKYIFLPFKMLDKNNTIEKSNNKSQGYIEDSSKAEYWNMNVLAPAGGLKCNGIEMLKYLAAMSQPINPESNAIVNLVTEPTHRLSPNMSVCRGWHTSQKKDKPVIYWHNGGTYGFSTFAAFVKGTGQTVMVVINKFNSNAAADKLGIDIINKMLE
jgi:CubicO group peptidase (beta-lactamase class C family)